MPPKRIKKANSKKKKKKQAKMETVKMFDYLEMPHSFGETETTLIIGDKCNGCGNDTYHRWYPEKIRKKDIGNRYKDFETEQDWKDAKLMNDWLVKHGMIDEPDTFCFHILIHVSW